MKGQPRLGQQTRGAARVKGHHQNHGASQEEDRRVDHRSESENPVIPSPAPMPHRPMSSRDWWPNQPNLQVLHQPSSRSSLAGEDFRYAEESKALDVEVLKRDILEVMTTSQDWWPADYGHWRSLTSRAPAARTAVGSQGTRPRRRMRRVGLPHPRQVRGLPRRSAADRNRHGVTREGIPVRCRCWPPGTPRTGADPLGQ